MITLFRANEVSSTFLPRHMRITGNDADLTGRHLHDNNCNSRNRS
jgi:hypothetical protein